MMMKGRKMLTTTAKNTMTLDVTKLNSQDHVKAMTREEMIMALYSRRVPSFSEMPSCNVLAVLVMVPAADPDGIESNTWMDWPKSALKKSNRIAADILIPIRRKQNLSIDTS